MRNSSLQDKIRVEEGEGQLSSPSILTTVVSIICFLLELGCQVENFPASSLLAGLNLKIPTPRSQIKRHNIDHQQEWLGKSDFHRLRAFSPKRGLITTHCLSVVHWLLCWTRMRELKREKEKGEGSSKLLFVKLKVWRVDEVLIKVSRQVKVRRSSSYMGEKF